MLRVKFKKLNAQAKAPSYAHPGDAGMDIYASEAVTIQKGAVAKIPTGIAFEIPDGYVGLVWDKSGLATNHGLKTVAGVIDAGYRGEVMIGIMNLGKEDYTIEKHHKVAQLLIQKVEYGNLEEAETLSDTSRGAGGFGSTGKH